MQKISAKHLGDGGLSTLNLVNELSEEMLKYYLQDRKCGATNPVYFKLSEIPRTILLEPLASRDGVDDLALLKLFKRCPPSTPR